MTKPTFKAGDRVYWLRFDNDSLKVDVLKVRENPFVRTKYTYPLAAFFDDKEIAVEFNKEGFGIFSYSIPVVVHATQENYEMLCKLFPHANWEKPKKVLRGDELCRHLLKTNKYVLVFGTNCSNTYKEFLAGKTELSSLEIVSRCDDRFYRLYGFSYKHAIPIDTKTGEVLEMEVPYEQ